MPRLRIAFALLAIGLAIPMGLLVQRALSGVRAEREARHRAVAERAFDEMERSLSDFLRTEEERSFGQYAFAFTPDGAPPDVRVRSPLAEPPAQPFVVGYFQLGADGAATSPLRPASASDERRLGKALHAPALDAAVSRTLGLARELAASARIVQLPAELEAQPPRVPAPPAKREKLTRSPEAPANAATSSAQPDAYDALESLNLGAEARAERAQKVVAQEVAPEAAAPELPPTPERIEPPPLELASDTAFASTAAASEAAQKKDQSNAVTGDASEDAGDAAGLVKQALRASEHADSLAAPTALPGAQTRVDDRVEALAERDLHTDAPLRDEAMPESAAARARADSKQVALAEGSVAPASVVPTAPALDATALSLPDSAPTARPRSRRVRVAVDPFVSRVAPSGELILVRTVLVGERGLRQGIVIDRVRLADFLRDATLAKSALPRSQLAFALAGEARSDPEQRRYRHRFAEPFDALAAELTLPPLAEGPGARAIEALALLVMLAAFGGLFALYRMVRTRLEFAERRSNFVAAVSHELKTPLTAIRMYAEMLRDGLVGSDAKRDEYHRAISSESERLSRLINNVLEFARIEKGARKGDARVGDVGPVVEEALVLLRPHAEQSGRTLSLACDAALPSVRFERDALVQVLFNLVDNAVKYARGASNPEIRVSCRAREGGVEIAVRDHGPGVRREELARILEPFHRGEDELTRKTQGAGIGLALVKSLSHDMGAAFRVDNADGGGFLASIQLMPPAADQRS